MNINKFIPAFLLTIMFSLIACEKEIDEHESDELLRLDAYVSIHYPEAIKTSTGLYYIIYEEGDTESSLQPGNEDFVIFNYSGMDLEEYVFETTNDSIAQLHDIYSSSTRYIPSFRQLKSSKNPLIAGLSEGLSLLKEGSKAKFLMPSSLAYGTTIYKGLNPYTSVIFDVELIKVVTDPEAYEQELIDNYLIEFYPDAIIDSILIDSVYFLTIIEQLAEDDDHSINGLYTQPTDQEIFDDDIVSVNYQGRFLDDFLFDTNIQSVAEENNIYDDSRTYEPIKVTVGDSQYIEGFSVALRNLTTYTYAKIIIPSFFAYGETGTSSIPPYSPLIFELDVLGKKASSTPD
jgi:FKBP-type peptidyl-prolyl cis-trans isomerase